jgi:hypothetical protein
MRGVPNPSPFSYAKTIDARLFSVESLHESRSTQG